MKIKNKKILLLSSVLALILIGGGVYAYSRNNNKKDVKSPASSTEDNEINLNPPTDDEKKAGDSVKDKFNDSEDKIDNNSGAVKTVTPEITYSDTYEGSVEVSSHVPGIFEKSGKCTLTLKKDGDTVTQSKNAIPNVSEMSCGLIKIPISKLSSGTWAATVSYSSAKAKGTSDKVYIEVK